MSSIDLASPDKRTIRRFFDSIAFRYDFLNSLLSLRLDEAWRRKARRIVMTGNESSLLDIGTGTGKFIQTFRREYKWRRIAGLDFSSEMLVRARGQLGENVALVSGDFHDLPFKDDSFDLAISAFTLRSVKQMDRFLEQVYALLAPGGRAAFLDLTRPTSFIWKCLYYPYLNWYLPLIGALFSGDREAYRFLSQSIQTFQDPAETAARMEKAGFSGVRCWKFTFGAATLIVGTKPE